MQVKNSSLVNITLMAGIFKSVSAFPIFLHLPIFVYGVFRAAFIAPPQKILLPSYFLAMLAIGSCIANNVDLSSYLKALMILGGIGIADWVSKQDPNELARLASAKVLMFVTLFLLVETVLIALGLGERERTLDALAFGSAGDQTQGGILLPRYMGFRGGSAFTAMLLGTLGLLCLAYRYTWQGMFYFAMSFLMMSRGPLLGMLVLLIYFTLGHRLFRIIFASLIVALFTGFPLVVYISSIALPWDIQMELIELSTMRYFHWVSFLHFGFDNPWLGVGYDNFKSYYIEYAQTYDALIYGNFAEHRLLEAHNMIMDIIGEVGFPAAIACALQMLIIFFYAIRSGYLFLPMLLYICVCSTFVSAVSDWCVWVTFGLIAGTVTRSDRSLYVPSWFRNGSTRTAFESNCP